LHYGLGVTLGNAEVRLDELVAAYSAFARGGEWIMPTYVPNPQRPAGHVLVSRRTAFWITDVLSDPEAREYVFGRGGNFDFPFRVAVKTGTSQAYHDNWTIGYSRDVTVGVWVGNFDRRPLRNSSGVTGAGPIFHAVMLAAERRVASRNTDPIDGGVPGHDIGGQSIEISALSGIAANSWGPSRLREWIPADSGLRPCHWHHLTDEGLLTVWPPEYRQWAMENREDRPTAGSNVIAAVHHGRSDRQLESFRIASPPDGATYLLDPTLRREFQSLSLRAVLPVPGPVEWSVDRRSLGNVQSVRSLACFLVPGRHTFVVRDAEGRSAESTIVVR